MDGPLIDSVGQVLGRLSAPSGGAARRQSNSTRYADRAIRERSRIARRPDGMTPPQPPESVPIDRAWLDRVIQGVATGGPLVALVAAGWLAWGGVLHWQDLVVLAIVYLVTGLGVTVGFHRLFTHRSFKTTRGLRALFAVLGSMAVEGALVEGGATDR